MKINREILLTILAPIICMFGGVILLALVYFIPNDKLEQNVKDAAATFERQGRYYSDVASGFLLDNFTDADAVSATYFVDSDNRIVNALHAVNYGVAVDGLVSAVNGNFSEKSSRAYQWYGFRIWLRPLLAFSSIDDIRRCCFFISLALLCTVCVLIAKVKKSECGFIPFLIAFSVFNFEMESLSLLFFTDFTIVLLGMMAVLFVNKWNKEGYAIVIFAGIGALIAFSSMLIMPTLTIGFPLIVWMSGNDLSSSKQKIKGAIRNLLAWCWGYFTTLVTKILIYAFMYEKETGVNKVTGYTGLGEWNINGRIGQVFVVFRNAVSILWKTEFLGLMIGVIVLLAYIVVKGKWDKNVMDRNWPILLVGLLPIGWIFCVAKHSCHGWTPWLFSISVYAILEFLWKMVERSGD